MPAVVQRVNDWEPAGEHGEREAMFRHLQEALLAIGFISDDTMETIMRRLRRMLGRAEMTADDGCKVLDLRATH